MKTWPYYIRCTTDQLVRGIKSVWYFLKLYITLLKVFRVILVQNKSFLSVFYQLTDSTPKKNRPIRRDKICPIYDAIYAEVLVQ